jgi:cell division protease FtsH
MVRADLANLANEAALAAARRGHEQVAMPDFTDALERIVLGAERKILRRPAANGVPRGGTRGRRDARPGADPVRKVSIILRGQALGVTVSAPDVDRLSYDEQDLLARIRGVVGGRVAEEIVFGTHTTGAESDLQQLTDIARRMVGRWGMSDAIGPMVTRPSDTETAVLPGPVEPQRTRSDSSIAKCAASSRTPTPTSRRCSPRTARTSTRLAHALLEHETR